MKSMRCRKEASWHAREGAESRPGSEKQTKKSAQPPNRRRPSRVHLPTRKSSMGDVAQLPGAADRGSTNLPGLIDRARARLAEARTSAEVLEARAAAKAVLEYARLTKATREAQADCFLIIKYAEMRLVEEVRAAQERGELARHGGVRKGAIKPRTSGLDRAASESGISLRGSGTDPATLDETGISSQRFAEWSEVYDAGGTATIKEAIRE